MKRVVVTGAAGFIGANVARRLLEDGYEATLMTGPGSDCWRLAEVEGSAPVVQLDLADGDAVAKAVSAARPEWILHLAAHGAYSWQTDRAAILRTNVVGTANLLEAARQADVEAFVNTGSSSEYGLKGRAPTEEDPLEPNSTYAVAKASATMLCRHVAEADGPQRVHPAAVLGVRPVGGAQAPGTRARRRGAARTVSTARRSADGA